MSLAVRTGNTVLDAALTELERRVARLEGQGVGGTTEKVIERVVQSAALLVSDGTNAGYPSTLSFDSSDGFTVTISSGTATATFVCKNIQIVGSDPGSPADGDAWFRSDTHELKVRSGGVTYKSAAFT